MKLFSNTISTLESTLNYSSQKQKVISQNIANVDTPNYKAKDVSFKATLTNAIENPITTNRTNNKHFKFTSQVNSNSSIITKKNVSYNENGNSVDVDKEMSDLATNQIYYNALIERISGKFTSLQNVIRGGN